MARNPKPVRRRYKAAHAAIRRGTYKYPRPTYDQLNDRKPASLGYRVSCVATNAAGALSAAYRGLSHGLSRALDQTKAAMLGGRTRDSFRLVE